MRNIRKHIVCVITVIMIFCSFVVMSETIKAEETNVVWSEESILQIASDCLGQKDLKIIYQQELYNLQNEVNAMLVKFQNGYIILGENTEVYPVIEYGVISGNCFLEDAQMDLMEEHKNVDFIKLYYFGGTEYFGAVKENEKYTYYDITGEKPNVISWNELEKKSEELAVIVNLPMH